MSNAEPRESSYPTVRLPTKDDTTRHPAHALANYVACWASDLND
jgi:hypothetical protein